MMFVAAHLFNPPYLSNTSRAMPAGQRSNMLAYQAKAGSLPTRPQTRFHVHFGAGRCVFLLYVLTVM